MHPLYIVTKKVGEKHNSYIMNSPLIKNNMLLLNILFMIVGFTNVIKQIQNYNYRITELQNFQHFNKPKNLLLLFAKSNTEIP